MDTTAMEILILKILAVLVLVSINGFFVAAEFAIVKIRGTQLDTLIAAGNRRAVVARHIVSNLNVFLSAAQLGITLASLGLGWIGEPVFAALLAPVLSWLEVSSPKVQHTISFVVGFTAITFLHIAAGEQAPKAMAIQKPLAASLWIAQPLFWFCRISYPFIWVLNNSSLWMLRKAGIEPADESERAHSEEELKLIVSAAETATNDLDIGRTIVLNAIDLRHRTVREVMRPRQEIVCLNTEDSIAQCLDVAEKTRYSRFPLCEGGDLERIIGIVHIKDLYASRIKARTGADLAGVVRKTIYLPDSARLERLLQWLLEKKLHLAIVVDEYGGTVGMVTLENILEALVGQIQDEFDQEKPLLEKLSDTQWRVYGALPLRDLAELVGEDLSEESVTTSGWITQKLGGFPRRGDRVKVKTFDLEVERMDGMIVEQIKATRIAPASAPLDPSL
jgi:CBS domain containing-hemolysin-like protein